ncbi:MAG: hypothetical protein L6Q66_01635 [Bacteroidia bacterium]|nr:hypothetical protein [Bacteroidia bacterium]MCK6648331.1 hypothetical protein [Bacteroidia bacterium]
MNKTFRVLEILWLIMGIVGVVMCAYFITVKDNEGAIYFLIFTLACGLMYSIRKRQRKRFEASQQPKSTIDKK